MSPIGTLDADHTCTPPNGALAPTSVSLLPAGVAKATAYPLLEAHSPFLPAVATANANANALASWMVNATASSSVQAAIVIASSLGKNNHLCDRVMLVSMLSHNRVLVFVESNCQLGGRKRNGNTLRSHSTPQSLTRLSTRRQGKLYFKKTKTATRSVKKPIVDPSKLMYRSNITRVIKMVLEFNFGTGHIKQLQKTLFWLMVEAIRVCNLNPKAYKKCDAIVFRIIQTYSPTDEKFHIGGKWLLLRNSDIHLLFGTQCGKENLNVAQIGKAPSDFI
ncbi:Protein TPR1 [Camellia lanceoleosa]|uniref:Protein TPR1 n=1 Tax=Camellia lanceoleosa TaxID=1840588 RepID=A0ACC0I7D5_9ERIC|nr:Protein TPR1 [Camellia lanceoleosa]